MLKKIVLCCALIIFGCIVEAKSEELNIGFVVKGSDDYWIQVTNGAKDAAKEFGVNLDINGPAKETMVEEHTSLIENNITFGVDALCVSPVQPAAQAKILSRAVKAGIPVLLIDTDADLKEKTTFLGTGNYAASELAGKYIAEKLGNKGNAVIIRGALGDKTHDDRTAGAKDYLETHGITVLDVQPADSDGEKAANVMENFLQNFDNIDAVFVTADPMALGALKAIEQSGKEKKIILIGFNGSDAAKAKINVGLMAGSVAQNPYMMGYLGVENAIKAAKGEMVDPRIDTGAKLITRANK